KTKGPPRYRRPGHGPGTGCTNSRLSIPEGQVLLIERPAPRRPTGPEHPPSTHGPTSETTTAPARCETPAQGHDEDVRRVGLEPTTRGLTGCDVPSSPVPPEAASPVHAGQSTGRRLNVHLVLASPWRASTHRAPKPNIISVHVSLVDA